MNTEKDLQSYGYVADALTEYNTEHAVVGITDILDKDNEAVLLLAEVPEYDITTSVLVYNNGTVFHLYDWQGDHPKTMKEVKDYEWLDLNGTETIMFAGKPRMLL